MSIQSDVEMLSIRVLEDYAKSHQLTESEAVELFYKYQVFEKLLLQHEYLHQLDYKSQGFWTWILLYGVGSTG